MEIFIFYETRKKEVNKKQSSLRKGRFLYLCVLLRFGNTLGIMPLSAPLSGEHNRKETSPLQLSFFGWAWVLVSW